ncbi:hypothetical protein BGZ96_004314, partial [Linnemannia gamsii]
MIGLLSANSQSILIDALKIAVPLGIGLASAALLAVKMNSSPYDKSIPNVPIRKGDSTHDKELYENHDDFLIRCEEEYGPIFSLKALNRNLTVISGPIAREVFMNVSFSSGDALNALTGVRAFGTSIMKSNKDDVDGRIVHDLVRNNITPALTLFTPMIVEQLEKVVDKQLGYCEGKAVEVPIKIFQDMIAYAMANVIMGPEVAKHRTVIDTFIQVTYDLGEVMRRGSREKFWHAWLNKTKYGMLNPLHKHIK